MQRQINPAELDVFYHAIGAAVWHIQYLEDALVMFIAMKKLKAKKNEAQRRGGEKISVDEARALLDRERRATLGAIYRKAKEAGIIPEEMEERFGAFLNERNWLIHRSKQENSADLYYDDLRVKVLDRISATQSESQELRDYFFRRMNEYYRDEGFDLAAAHRTADAALRKLRGEA